MCVTWYKAALYWLRMGSRDIAWLAGLSPVCLLGAPVPLLAVAMRCSWAVCGGLGLLSPGFLSAGS